MFPSGAEDKAFKREEDLEFAQQADGLTRCARVFQEGNVSDKPAIEFTKGNR